MYKPPAIPPIQHITDKPTKDALFALAEGWQVRNGLSGSGGDRFVTKDEFDAAIKKIGDRPTLAQEEVAGAQSRSGGSSTSPILMSSDDLLPKNNRWTGLNQFERPTPADNLVDNWHIKLSRDGQARWLFQLGHEKAPGSVGNLYFTDSARVINGVTEPGGISVIFESMENGGALSFLGRTLANQLNKTAIRLRDTMSIDWNLAGSVKTAFNPNIGMWAVSMSGVNRFAVNANTEAPDAIRINDGYLADWMTMEAKYGAYNSISWNTVPATRVSLQKIVENIVTTSVDLGLSINNIRNLTGEGFTSGGQNALMAKLSTIPSAVSLSKLDVIQKGSSFGFDDAYYVDASKVLMRQQGSTATLQTWWDAHVQYTIDLENKLIAKGVLP